MDETADNSSSKTSPGIPFLFPTEIGTCQTTRCICFNLWTMLRWTLWFLSIEVAFFEGWKMQHIFQDVRQVTYWRHSLGLVALYHSKLCAALLSMIWIPNSAFGLVYFWGHGFRGRRIGLEVAFFVTFLCLAGVILVVPTKSKYAKAVAAAVEISRGQTEEPQGPGPKKVTVMEIFADQQER